MRQTAQVRTSQGTRYPRQGQPLARHLGRSGAFWRHVCLSRCRWNSPVLPCYVNPLQPKTRAFWHPLPARPAPRAVTLCFFCYTHVTFTYAILCLHGGLQGVIKLLHCKAVLTPVNGVESSCRSIGLHPATLPISLRGDCDESIGTVAA